jgi:hypothetical protein
MVTTPTYQAPPGQTQTTAGFANFDDEQAAAMFIEACNGQIVPELGPGVLQVC